LGQLNFVRTAWVNENPSESARYAASIEDDPTIRRPDWKSFVA
jgi:hypothetical protein